MNYTVSYGINLISLKLNQRSKESYEKRCWWQVILNTATPTSVITITDRQLYTVHLWNMSPVLFSLVFNEIRNPKKFKWLICQCPLMSHLYWWFHSLVPNHWCLKHSTLKNPNDVSCHIIYYLLFRTVSLIKLASQQLFICKQAFPGSCLPIKSTTHIKEVLSLRQESWHSYHVGNWIGCSWEQKMQMVNIQITKILWATSIRHQSDKKHCIHV